MQNNNMKKIAFLLLIIILVFLEGCSEVLMCDDGTPYEECSLNKSFFCKDGSLTKKIEVCGCPENKILDGNTCVSKFITESKIITLEYNLKGKTNSMGLVVYPKLGEYLAGLPRVFYCDPDCPSRREQELKYLNDMEQKEFLEEIAKKIVLKTENKDDQARIAISIIQNIPYDSIGFESGNLNNRYPYEVILDQKGVCGEKSRTLAFLLRELGYGVVLFSYETENHMAVGIKCSVEYSYKESNYCFVETTAPTIITNDNENYLNVGKLISEPEIILISEGKSFDSVKEEFEDYLKYQKLRENFEGENYKLFIELRKKYGLEEKECEEEYILCNGLCHKECEQHRLFECTEEGAYCNWDANNCPENMIACNNTCWGKCEKGTFKCKKEGAVCEITVYS